VSLFGNRLIGEVEYTHLRGDEGSAIYGFYLQDSFPLLRDLYGVLRVETVKQRTGGADTGELVGLFWRPLPFLILKANYQFGNISTEDAQPGFVGSLTLFF